jgi:Mn2+/Fe2+ NRAMP family transporter
MFTICVLLTGFVIASVGLLLKIPTVNLMIFGQALTVVGNPLMAATMLWLANRQSVMGDRRNGLAGNIIGVLGIIVVLLLALRMLWFLILHLSLALS